MIDTAAAMFEDGDVGPLLDYFDDHGLDKAAVRPVLADIVLRLNRADDATWQSAKASFWSATDQSKKMDAIVAQNSFIARCLVRYGRMDQALAEWRRRHGVSRG